MEVYCCHTEIYRNQVSDKSNLYLNDLTLFLHTIIYQ